MNTAEKILSYIKSKGQASPHDIYNYMQISRVAVHKQLNTLLNKGLLYKIGMSPKVFYCINENKSINAEVVIDQNIKDIIENKYLIITPSGQKIDGLKGFSYWCQNQNLDIKKTALEYVNTLKKYEQYKVDGVIDGMYKIKNTFKKVYVDKLFYLDFYAIERFGKTKLGQILLYAKQSQNKKMIHDLVSYIKPNVEFVIKKYDIDAIGYIPPTVKREVQLMKEIRKQLHISLPELKIVKIKTPVVVPQKTLNKINDRIENAKETIVVDDNKKYKNVLLIDDALGSGATINETAKKIIDQGNAQVIVGLAITGSFSGFEIISEV